MLSLMHESARLCDGIRRREAMRIGALGVGGLTMPLLQQSSCQAVGASAGRTPRTPAKSCLVLFLMGGPPQHSTFDPKPDAPSEVRGAFGAIDSVVPGIQLGELWPRTARVTDRLAILRAVSTGDNAHSSSGYYMLTGQPHTPKNRENANPGFPNDRPNWGAVVRRQRSDPQALPSAVRLPHHIFNTDGSVWPGQDAGFLGKSVDPWLVNFHPNLHAPKIDEFRLGAGVSEQRLDERRRLLSQLGRQLPDRGGRLTADPWDSLSNQAFDVLSSAASRQAFDLERESPATRDRYGRTPFGQSVLMGRRLVDAGVSLVQVNWYRGPDEPSNAPCWDSHAVETQRLKSVLCPPADQALSALIDDLDAQGRLEETLVVVMAEFGRTPRFNAAGGRDHWGHVFSVALAGGGIRGGVVHGASDALGAWPHEGRVTPEDLTATMFHLLGLDPHASIPDRLGRPLPISRGEPIREILA